MSSRAIMRPSTVVEAHTSPGYEHALELLRRCVTPDGFLASTTPQENYKRVWSRDGVVMGLAGLLTDDTTLHQSFFDTLRTLKENQGPHGEIPSNVDPSTKNVSYGGNTGRVDAGLWYVIGCGAYWRHTQDKHFLQTVLPSIEAITFLLGAWEYNNRGLLYVPETGDWSDEYIQHGYVLYDELLYWRALSEVAGMYGALRHAGFDTVTKKLHALRNLIIDNYRFSDEACAQGGAHAYHPILYRKGCAEAVAGRQFWLSYFSPMGYGVRFDALANIFVSLFGIANAEQSDRVDAYVADVVTDQPSMLLPAFHPVIGPSDPAWDNLQVSCWNAFKNGPYEYQNGGLWPYVTGCYVADLARRGKKDLARRYLEGIDRANALDAGGKEWGFYEYHHGKDRTPKGTRHQGWSAAASVIGHHALQDHFFL